jgi:hypothetical protein
MHCHRSPKGEEEEEEEEEKKGEIQQGVGSEKADVTRAQS